MLPRPREHDAGLLHLASITLDLHHHMNSHQPSPWLYWSPPSRGQFAATLSMAFPESSLTWSVYVNVLLQMFAATLSMAFPESSLTWSVYVNVPLQMQYSKSETEADIVTSSWERRERQKG
ncbi:hypothetical protein MRB53_033635 [Persea americana]|uniref:Uncharacterized protein n=1 Tax=Persea americana TaxID=3435 RepID=A0ACC2KVL0_PERAE|nr:hypothetical protein MRB53_033635 [Persea americana]